MNNDSDWPPKPLVSQLERMENTKVVADTASLRYAVSSLAIYGVAMLLWCGVTNIAISPLRSSVSPFFMGLAALAATLLLFVSFGLAIPARRSTLGAVALSLSGVGAFLSLVLVVACVIVFASKRSGH